MNRKAVGAGAIALVVVIAFLANVQSVSASMPQKGDYFGYSETITVDHGQGSYEGYTDQNQITGTERVNSINGNIVSVLYSNSYQYSSNQGNTTSGSTSGNYTWSSSSFTYVNGTDNQVGYAKPTYVWFAMDTLIAVGGTFYILNTKFTVLSKNFSLQLPTEGNVYVQTIQVKGTGTYQRNDAYGVFSAPYTWYAYFDPTTGYIIGYSYVEQDTGHYQGQPGSFTYADTLYVTSTSYSLASATAPPNPGPGLADIVTFLGVIVVVVVVLVVIAIALFVVTRRKRKDTLPEHSPTPYPPPSTSPSTQWESRIDLGSQPPQQVVIRDVAKVNCRYCGTLIPTTADRCPYCGGPRQ